MKDIETKREREKKMVSQMIALYCRRNHHTKGVLCPECAALNDYARACPSTARSWRRRPSASTAACTATNPTCVKRSAP